MKLKEQIGFRFDGPIRVPRSSADFRAECKACGLEPLSTVQACSLAKEWNGLPKGTPMLVITRTEGGTAFILDGKPGEVPAEVEAEVAELTKHDGPLTITITGGGVVPETHAATGDLAMDLAWALDELERRGAKSGEPVSVYEGDLAKLNARAMERDLLEQKLADLTTERDALAAELLALKPGTDANGSPVAPNDA